MERVTLLPSEALYDGWIAPQYIPEGKVDYLAVISWDMEKNVDAIHEFMFESEEE